jgi:threonine aldolase
LANSKVGDDVFGEDPSVNKLQEVAAEMFGMESAIFCPSGTMTNQIAINVHTQPGDEVICESGAHIHYYEGGGIAFNSGASTKPIEGTRGVFTAEQLQEALRPSNVHFPRTSLVSIENTCNRGGGKIFPFDEILKIREVCNHNQLKLHLDGARLFNAIVESNHTAKDFGKAFDSISICLSKGLGAPVGSLLLGKKEFIYQALRIRKVLGGGMRQAGYLASAGLFALHNNIKRLKDDNLAAKVIGGHLSKLDYVSSVLSPETNMVVFELKHQVNCNHFLHYLESQEILAFEVGPNRIRFVFHLSLPENSLQQITQVLSGYSSSNS